MNTIRRRVGEHARVRSACIKRTPLRFKHARTVRTRNSTTNEDPKRSEAMGETQWGWCLLALMIQISNTSGVIAWSTILLLSKLDSERAQIQVVGGSNHKVPQ